MITKSSPTYAMCNTVSFIQKRKTGPISWSPKGKRPRNKFIDTDKEQKYMLLFSIIESCIFPYHLRNHSLFYIRSPDSLNVFYNEIERDSKPGKYFGIRYNAFTYSNITKYKYFGLLSYNMYLDVLMFEGLLFCLTCIIVENIYYYMDFLSDDIQNEACADIQNN